MRYPTKPLAGTDLEKQSGFHGKVDSPLSTHLQCIKDEGVPAKTVNLRPLEASTPPGPYPGIQVGTAPAGPTVVFEPTPGAAQALQITAQVEGAEIIGSALLYTNLAGPRVLTEVENCLESGVTG